MLIVLDTHSKWIEAFPAKSPSSSVTIELLCSVFAQLGLPKLVVSDNASCFVSEEFDTSSNGAMSAGASFSHSYILACIQSTKTSFTI